MRHSKERREHVSTSDTLPQIDSARALDLAASEAVNINVFPNLSILGNHIQVFQPIAVDETDSTWYATAVVDETGELGGAR